MSLQYINGKSIHDWYKSYPLLKQFMTNQEVVWLNNNLKKFAEIKKVLPLKIDDITDAAKRLERFAPYINLVFPETKQNKGIIESQIMKIPNAQIALEKIFSIKLSGKLLIKRDDQLPISGSIKARGGIYEVLKHAETLAIKEKLLAHRDNYKILNSEICHRFFNKHHIIVGSTGNLGLSIGIMGAQLGFKVTVHMSSDAQQWKKNLLKTKGVGVIEHNEDYGIAVKEGRLTARNMSHCHFIDDENSKDLFLGYSVAGERLKQQLEQQKIIVNKTHPLCVYLPCGVGGAPGGVAFGLKQVFGDAVHCFFAEPTHSACMFLGMYTGLHDRISVQDFGVDNLTCADGLAVGRPSAFVGHLMESLIDGIYTVTDENLYLALLKDYEGIELEPSALAGLPGIIKVVNENKKPANQSHLAKYSETTTHLVWATGGNMVPSKERAIYYQKGKDILKIKDAY